MERISEYTVAAIDCASHILPIGPGGIFSILDLAVTLSFGRTFPSMLVCHHELRDLLPFDVLPLGEGVWSALGQGVHLRAALVACMVHLISPNVDAVLFAAFCKQLLLGRACHEHINVAFDLLSGRPIDLAICFQALFLWIILADLNLTGTPALLVADLAVQEVAGVPLTIASLALGLLAITFSILLDVISVGFSALLVKAIPLLESRGEEINLLADPLAKCLINLQVLDFATTNALAVPGGVWKIAASFVIGRARVNGCSHEMVKVSACCDVLLVESEKVVSANLVSRAIAFVSTTVVSGSLVLLTTFKAQNIVMQRLLRVAMCLPQGVANVTEQFSLDECKCSLDVSVKFTKAIADALFDKILNEGIHLGDIAVANSIQEVVDSCFQSCVHFQ